MSTEAAKNSMQKRALEIITTYPGCVLAYIKHEMNLVGDREIDRALQSLRRRGVVTFTRAGGWVVAKKESA